MSEATTSDQMLAYVPIARSSPLALYSYNVQRMKCTLPARPRESGRDRDILLGGKYLMSDKSEPTGVTHALLRAWLGGWLSSCGHGGSLLCLAGQYFSIG